MTWSLAPALTTMPFVPDTSTPASKPSLSDSDRLGDGHGAEAAGIETVDLAACRGLRDGAGEGLAGSRAAARVGVVADAGNPSTGRLRMGGNDRHRQKKREAQQARAPVRVTHCRLRWTGLPAIRHAGGAAGARAASCYHPCRTATKGRINYIFAQNLSIGPKSQHRFVIQTCDNRCHLRCARRRAAPVGALNEFPARGWRRAAPRKSKSQPSSAWPMCCE